MTGKELMIALVGAGLVGGAAGFAATIAAPAREPVADKATEDLAVRLKAAEDGLARATSALDASKKTIDALQERVTKAEIEVAKRPEPTAFAAPSPATKPGQRIIRRRGTDAADVATAFEGVDFAVGMPENVDVQLRDALDGLGAELGDVGGRLGEFRAGLELRKLPEADRWQKAKDDLGLTWNQVEDLKKAVADRDAAMKDAANVEKKTSPAGGTITISRPDPTKTARAQATYQESVDAALPNADQRKNWRSKGYDQAFGKPGFGGGAMVMTVDVAADKPDLFKSGDK